MRVCNFVGLLALTVAVAFGSTANAQYSNDFESYAAGTTDLGDGTTLADNQGNSVVGVTDNGIPGFGNALQLAQDDVGSFRSSFRIPAVAGSSQGWTAEFDFLLSDAAGDNPPADGFNFSYGAIPAYDPGAGEASNEGHGQAENAWAGVDHLSFEIDTWMNGDAEVGYNIAVHDVDSAFQNMNVFEDGETAIGHAIMSYDAGAGTASMSIDFGAGNVLNGDFDGADVSGFAASDDYTFAFGTRTGGANETLLVDNLSITAVPEPSTIVLALMSIVAIGFGIRRRS